MTAPPIRGRWTLWPCSHQGVLVEPSDVPPGYRCAECGASPVEVVPVPDDAAVERAARAMSPVRWDAGNMQQRWREHYLRKARAVLAAAFEARP